MKKRRKKMRKMKKVLSVLLTVGMVATAFTTEATVQERLIQRTLMEMEK